MTNDFVTNHHYKSWKITALVPVGAALMIGGFAAREACAFHMNSLPLFITSTVLLLSGPPIWAGANYFMLARLLYYIPWLWPIHPSRVLTTFVGVDLLIKIMTGNGASRVANASASAGERKVGEYLIKVSLILQACTFAAFVTTLAIWHVRVRRAGLLSGKLRPAVLALYTSSALITIRCIYRSVEYFQGYNDELYSHEACFWVFEAVLMLANSVLLKGIHPGRFLPQDNRVFLAADGKTGVQGPGWRDTRRWYWPIADPFDLRSCCGRAKQIGYWKNAQEEYYQLESRAGWLVTNQPWL